MLRKLAVYASLFVFASANAFCLEIVEKQIPAVRGVQLFVLDGSYAGEYDRFMAELADKGTNTLFVRVFHNTVDRTHGGVANPCADGGVYFNTSEACVVDDILPAIIQSAHKYGIQVYGWMATRSLSFLKTPENMSLSFTADGNTVPGYGANIFEPFVKGKLTALFADLARTGVDGILLQDDFIMKYTEGADIFASRKFTKDTGIECAAGNFYEVIDSSGAKRFGKATANGQIWHEWKAKQLQEMLIQLRSTVRLVNPEIKWAVNIYYETPVYPHQGLAWYSQDINGIFGAGVDYLAVMTYQEQIMSELNLDMNRFLDFVSGMSSKALDSTDNPARIIFKLQVRRFDANRTPLRDLELKLLCNRLERSGGTSFVQLPLFSPADLLSVCGFE